MLIGRTIPGPLRDQEGHVIEVLASLMPAQSAIVEIGSPSGLSSWVWKTSAGINAAVYCIDPWEIADNSKLVSLDCLHHLATGGILFGHDYHSDCSDIRYGA